MKLVRVVFAKAFSFPGVSSGLPIKSASGADYSLRVEDDVVFIQHAKSPSIVGVPVAQCELLIFEPTPGPKKVA